MAQFSRYTVKTYAMQPYDPMRKFWDLFIPFLFKQIPLIVFMSFAVAVMWVKIGNMEAQARIDRIEIRKECATSIAEIRHELKACQSENDTLRKQNDTLRTENYLLHKRFTALELKLKHYVKR